MNHGLPFPYRGLLGLYLDEPSTDDTAIAISVEGIEITHARLERLSTELSETIRETGCSTEGGFFPVAAGMGRSAEQVISLIAIWKLNAVYVPVNLDRDIRSLPSYLKSTGIRVLICHKAELEEALHTLGDCLQWVICFYSAHKWELIRISKSIGHSYRDNDIADAKTGYLVRTSGSTGSPKTVYGSVSSLDHFITWQAGRFTDHDKVNTGWLTEPTFDASFRDLLLPLVKGGTISIPPGHVRELPSALVQWIDREEISHLHLVPSVFRIILSEIEDGSKGISLFKKLKYVFLSGEAMQPSDVNRWYDIFGRRSILVNFYGSTETTLIRTYHEFLTKIPTDQSSVPAGRALPDTVISISHDQPNYIPGQAGQVIVHTSYPTFGYLDGGRIDEPWTKSSEQADMIAYTSGDIGYLDNAGNLYIEGRSDDQIKIRGVRIDLKGIEWAAYRIASIKNAKVIVDDSREQLCLFFTASANIDTEAGKREMSQFLPDSHVPGIWFRLDEMPLNENGKIDVRKLKAYRSEKKIAAYQEKTFISQEEKSLAKLWSEVLNADIGNRTDNFFDHGGNSLNGMLLLSKIQKEFKRQVRIRDLFRNPVLHQMLEFIQNAPFKGLAEIPNVKSQDHYPVSAAQRRMWVLHNMEKNSITYNIKRAYEIAGDIDVRRLEEAFDALIVRQESLRTNFRVHEGVPVQFIRASHAHCFRLKVIDLTLERDRNHAVRSIANNEVHYTFNLENESLLRATLIQLEQNKNVLLINVHHIISDGWSMELLMKSLISDYSHGDKDHSDNQPPVQYRDYAAWQNELVASESQAHQKEYWLKEFEGDLPKVELQTDRSRAAIKTYDGKPVYFTIDQDTKEKIAAICSRLDVSLFMFLLSTTKLLLYKYSGQKDLIIGSPVAGRDHPSLTNLIGFFVNMVALRTAIDPNDSFETYLQQVKEKVLDGFDHRSYPFDQLVEDLDLPRETGRSPLFDITFQVLNVEFWEDTTESHLTIKPFIADWERSQFDLSFFFKERSADIFGLIEFNTNLFDEERIVRLISHFKVLLGEVLSEMDKPVKKLNYLTAQERKNLLYGFNERTPFVKNEVSVIDILASATKSGTALTGGKKGLSYDSLFTLQDRIAGFVVQQGLHQEVIAVLSEDRSSILPAMLGIMASGNIYLPLDPRHPLDRMLESLAGTGVKMIMYDLEHMIRADKLMWGLESVLGSLCLNSQDHNDFIPDGGELMRKDLWNFIGERAEDQIQGGGWTSSYTGLPFSMEEMEEYADNALFKILPYANTGSRVLEIGCSSGITLHKVAPLVDFYLGLDLSAEILRITQKSVDAAGLINVKLMELAAHELSLVAEGDFDVIIINSVIQSFASYNYFKDVLDKVLAKAAPHATLFIGDIQDIRLRNELIASLRSYSQRNQNQKQRTKLVWDDELFFHPQYFKDLAHEFPELVSFDVSRKKGQLINELTLFRYDLIVKIDKDQRNAPLQPRGKWKSGIGDLTKQGAESLPAIRERDIAYIIFTSGTTGVPKGVEVTHGALVNQILGFHEVYKQRLTSADRFLLTSKTTFDVSVLEMFLGLSAGGTLVEVEHNKPIGAEYFVSAIKEFQVTWAYLPPALLMPIFELFNEQGGAIPLQFLLVGVEPIPFDTLDYIHSICPDMVMINGYGPTEATIVSSFYPYKPNDTYERVPIGGPMPGYEIFVLDDDLELAGIGIPGQIVIAGKGLANGYRNSTSMSGEKFVFIGNLDKRVYLTGDIAFWDKKGNLNFIGRHDRQVKFNGFRIELSDIDAQILKFPGVRSALTVIVRSEEDFQQLVTYVEVSENLDEGQMKLFLSALLPSYMIPNRVISIDAFPLTSHGKIDHGKLNNLLFAQNGMSRETASPSTATEVILHRLFRTILNREDIGIDDNFFELGGHSLLATRLITKAAKEEGVDVQLVDVFTHPTIRQLASRVKQYDHEDLSIGKIQEDPRGIYPASFGQERLWVIGQLNPDDPSILSAYNMAGLFKLEGNLPADLLQKAIQLLITRHESLRTNIIEIEGIPHQIVHAHRTFSLEFLALTEEDESTDIVLDIAAELASRPFDLEQDLLLKMVLIKGPRTSYMLTLMHHIISDGWSMHRFSLELSDAISWLKSGKKRMPELPVQYKDYSAWLKKRVTTLSDAQIYWESLLSETHDPTVIQGDHKRPSWRTFNGSTIRTEIPERDANLIHQYCRSAGVSLFALLNAALHVLIHRCSGLNNITTGSPVSGRNHPMLEEQIGFYLNNIVVRTELRGSLKFHEYVSSVHHQLTKSLLHQEYPFDLLVENLYLEHDPAHAPFFDIYLALQNNEDPILDFGEFAFHDIPMDRKVSRFDLNFMVSQSDNLKLTLQFNTDLYRKETAGSLINAWRNILLHVIKGEYLIKDIPLLDHEEMRHLKNMPKASLAHDPRMKGNKKPRNLTEAFYAIVEKRPDHIALVEGEAKWTYKELDNASSHLAWQLMRQQTDKTKPVALDLERGVSRVIAILAVLKSGAPFLPLDPNLPTDRKMHQLGDAACSTLISHDNAVIQGIEVIPMSFNKMPADAPEVSTSGDDIAYILYTSGTTGAPKGVQVTHGNVLSLLVEDPVIDMSDKDVWTMFHQYYFDFSVWEMWGALLHGGKLVVLSEDEVKDLDMFADIIYSQGVTILNQTPMVFYLVKDLLIDRYEEKDLKLEKVIFGGDKLTPSLLMDFAERFPSVALINMYGITETTIHVTAKSLDKESLMETTSNIGRAIPSLSVYIIDHYGNPLPKGIPGQLVVAGKGVSRGYLNDSNQTARKFSTLPFLDGVTVYFSGDKAKWLPNNDLEYFGRIDHQLKIRGHRVEAAEIESAIESSAWVQKAIVLKTAVEEDERLYGFAEPVDAIKWRMQALRSFPELKSTKLPNGSTIFHMNESETRFMYNEIVEDDGYHLRNLALDPDPVILDAGANIGMFTVLCASIWPSAEIYAFEPIPDVFKCLQANVHLLNSKNIRIFNEGLSDRREELILSYYPFNTVMSGAGVSDREILQSYLKEQYASAGENGDEEVDLVLEEALESVQITCPVSSVTHLIDTHGLERIDLLKVDVEDWEEKIVRGVAAHHWDKIQNMILEVHDKEGRLSFIRNFLTERGFEVKVVQTRFLSSTGLYNVVALKNRAVANGLNTGYDRFINGNFPPENPQELFSSIRSTIQQKLASYMIPDEIFAVETIPLTRNGKVDRTKLLDIAKQNNKTAESTEWELGRRGKLVVGILEDVLRKKVGSEDDFFHCGGNSLNATKVVNRVKGALSIDLKVRDLFKNPVVRDLLVYIESLHVSAVPGLTKTRLSEYYPVTHAQHQILTSELMKGEGASIYNMTGGMTLEGDLQIGLLEDTFRLLVERYEILRTRFVFQDGDFVQKISPDMAVPFHLHEVPKVDEGFCKDRLEELQRTSFRLDELPLFRIELYAGPDNHYFLALLMHHIISDGWSMSVLNSEVAKIYNSLLVKSLPDPNPLRFQFKDYADWHRSLLENEEWLNNQRKFWSNELVNAPVLELPYDYQTKGDRSFTGKTISVNLENWEEIQKDLSLHSLTDFSFLLTSVYAFLRKLSDQEDIMIGCPVAGRPLAELEDQLGFFVNTLPIRLKGDKNASLRGFMLSVQQKFMDVLEYQLLPYNQIMELGRRNKDLKPLINVLMIYQNNDRPNAKMNGITETRIKADHEGALFDLVLIFSPIGEELGIELQYNDSLFEAQTAVEMSGLLLDTLSDCSINMDRPLAEVVE